MKPLRTRLSETREQLGLTWDVIERDYLLSWILVGITQVDALKNTLIFKGGTALRKCYFGDYRLSEDLDFTSIYGVPTGAAAEETQNKILLTILVNANKYLFLIVFPLHGSYTNRVSYPNDTENLKFATPATPDPKPKIY